MAIFEKDKEHPVSGPGTVVGTNVKLTGILKDSSDITVHGKVEGEVVSDRNVTVTETAEIKGPITAQNIVVAGKVNGAVTANEKIEILPTGHVYGAIAMKELIIRSGAIFIGKSTMPEKKGGQFSPEKESASPAKESKNGEV